MSGVFHRWRVLKAYAKDLDRHSGGLRARQEIAHRFNALRFWWQKERAIPAK